MDATDTSMDAMDDMDTSMDAMDNSSRRAPGSKSRNASSRASRPLESDLCCVSVRTRTRVQALAENMQRAAARAAEMAEKVLMVAMVCV